VKLKLLPEGVKKSCFEEMGGGVAGVRLRERQSWTRLNPSRYGESFKSGTTALIAGVSTAFT
jgi:hypothetical protein